MSISVSTRNSMQKTTCIVKLRNCTLTFSFGTFHSLLLGRNWLIAVDETRFEEWRNCKLLKRWWQKFYGPVITRSWGPSESESLSCEQCVQKPRPSSVPNSRVVMRSVLQAHVDNYRFGDYSLVKSSGIGGNEEQFALKVHACCR